MYKKTRRKKNIGKQKALRITKKSQRGGSVNLKVMSYNVLARGSTPYQPHNYEFKNNRNDLDTISKPYEHIEQTIERYEKIKREIEEQDPRIVLLQEVDDYFFTYILRHLPNYDGHFKPYIPPNLKTDLSLLFYTAVLWKKDFFTLDSAKTLDNLIAMEDIKNGEIDDVFFAEPAEPAEPKNISFLNKNATLVKLKYIDSGSEKTITIVSFHLPGDRKNPDIFIDEKKNLIMHIIESLKKYTSDYTIIGGDLNCPINSRQFEWLLTKTEEENLTKIDQATTNVTTCDYDFSSTPNDKQVIDTIFCSNRITLIEYKVQDLKCIDDVSNPLYGKHTVYNKKSEESEGYFDITNGSDHAWILAELSMK